VVKSTIRTSFLLSVEGAAVSGDGTRCVVFRDARDQKDGCILILFAHANYPTNALAHPKILPLMLTQERQVATTVPVLLDA
jgi:hypothetical protein